MSDWAKLAWVCVACFSTYLMVLVVYGFWPLGALTFIGAVTVEGAYICHLKGCRRAGGDR